MARNGSGVYAPPATDYPAVAFTLIESAKYNNVVDDIATALTGSIAADGQTTITANLPMNSKKLTGLAAGATAGDSVRFEQLTKESVVGLTTADSPQFAGINLGHASDTTFTRVSAGVAAIEGVNILTTATGAALAGSSSQDFATAALTTSGNITLNNTSGTGVIRATGNSTVTTYMFGSSGGGLGAIGTETNHPCDLYTNGTQKVRIDTSGNVMVVTAALLGYGTGAGGTVTQTTSKSTAVTLNKPCGQITMHNAALGAGATAYFALNNSLVAIADILSVGLAGGAVNYEKYDVWATSFAAGQPLIMVRNTSAGSLSEALVINFQVHKSVTA